MICDYDNLAVCEKLRFLSGSCMYSSEPALQSVGPKADVVYSTLKKVSGLPRRFALWVLVVLHGWHGKQCDRECNAALPKDMWAKVVCSTTKKRGAPLHRSAAGVIVC